MFNVLFNHIRFLFFEYMQKYVKHSCGNLIIKNAIEMPFPLFYFSRYFAVCATFF